MKIPWTIVAFIFAIGIVSCRANVDDPSNTDDSGDTDTDADTDTDTGSISDDTDDTDTFFEDFDSDFDTDPEADGIGPGSLCPEGTPDLFNSTKNHYFGGTESLDLVVYVFSYFRCPWCPAFAVDIHELWSTRPEYMKRVRLFFHPYPFGSNPDSDEWLEHGAAISAGIQGDSNFWAIHNLVFNVYMEDPAPPDELEDIIEFAKYELGLYMPHFLDELDSTPVANYMAWEKTQLNDLGYSSTPSVFLCGEKINWGLLEYEIEQYLNPKE